MKNTAEVLIRGIGGIGLAVAKAFLADVAVVAKRHGFNQIAEGTSCVPDVLNGEFAHEPKEGSVPPPEPAKEKAKAKAAPAKPVKAKAKPAKAKKATPKKKGAKKSK